MALFEMIFGVPSDSWDTATMSVAVVDAGFPAAIVATVRPGVFSIQAEHCDSKFDRGALIADEILPFLPEGSNLISVRMAAHISELDDKDIAAILTAEYGEQGR